MREIRFRAWDGKQMFNPNNFYGIELCLNKVGGWCLWKLSGEGNKSKDVLIAGEYDDKKLILLQFTGLYDKNNKPIFEGDILSGSDDNELMAVEWDSAEACFIGVVWANDEIETEGGADCGLPGPFCEVDRQGFHGLSDTRTWAEVIGNLYETPELLEGGK